MNIPDQTAPPIRVADQPVRCPDESIGKTWKGPFSLRSYSIALAPACVASLLALTQPSHAQDAATLGAAEFGAGLAAEIETVTNLCSQYFFVNPRVADEMQADGFAMLSQVPDAKAQELLNLKIAASLQEVAATDPESWCKSTRDRMRKTGGPFAALYAE